MRVRALVAVSLCALVFPAAAAAHATLERATPANGSVLSTPPRAVRFVFDDGVRVASGVKAIRNDGESVLASKPRVLGGRTLVVPLRHNLGDGDYTVLWRVVSDDGHTSAGVSTFGVGAGRAPPVAALSVRNRPTAKDVVSRWLLFAGLLTAVGAAFFRFAVGAVPLRLLLGALLLVFVGVSGLLHDVPVSSRFGGVMASVAVVSGVGALLAAIAPVYPRLEPLPFVVALVLLPGPSIAGHALDRGRSAFQVVVDVAHVAAASVWLGGVVALALALRVAGDGRTLRRFSNVAVASVLLLSVTGIARALSELRSVSQIWGTGYGQALIAKTALLAVLVAIGWLNRYRLVPRASVDGLRRTTAAELLLFGGLLIAVALLTDLRPGRDRVAFAAVAPNGPPPLPAPNMVVQASELGDDAVALATNRQRAEVTVLGPDATGVNGLDVTINRVSATSCGAGCYAVDERVPKSVEVRVGGRLVRFWVPRRARPARRLVLRATRAFRALRSVSYIERLASSPRNRVVSEFTLERPNRLAYHIRGGASGILIGARRWDRTGKGPWVSSAQEPTPQPEPIWAGSFTNAYLFQANADEYAVGFMKPIGPTWFLIWLNRRTLLPIELSMTTAAHFMQHRYTHFNAPRRIKPPRP